MSLAFDTLLRMRCRVVIYQILTSDFACVGTPDQLKLYLDTGQFYK